MESASHNRVASLCRFARPLIVGRVIVKNSNEGVHSGRVSEAVWVHEACVCGQTGDDALMLLQNKTS